MYAVVLASEVHVNETNVIKLQLYMYTIEQVGNGVGGGG